MMRTVDLARAKASLSDLLDMVEGGEDIVITRHGRPVAQFSAVSPPKQPFRSLSEFRAMFPRLLAPTSTPLREARDESL